jgi:hypothetical protein
VTLIAPGPSVAADWEERRQRKKDVPYAYFSEAQASHFFPPAHPSNIHLAPSPFGSTILAQYD